jgi:hypothetical protein
MLIRNLSALIIPGILSLILSLLLNDYSSLISANWYFGILFLLLLCFILNLIYAHRSDSKTFTELLLAALVIKLLLALIAIILYSFFDKPGFFNFSIHFILHYILFTIFEIRYLLFIIKKRQTSSS